MQIRRSNLRRIAGSSSQGKFVAPSTSNLFLVSWPTPSICTKNSVLTLLLDQLSPSPRLPVIESTSSMKMMLEISFLAISNKDFTIFSLSPTNLLMMSLLDTLKKVDSDISLAQALAMKVLPVPGGPQSRIPFQGLRLPLKISGKRRGMMTASLSASLAFCKPATSSQVTLGFSLTTTPSRLFIIWSFSLLGSLFSIFLRPSLLLMYQLIVLSSFKKSSSASLKAPCVDQFSSFSSSMNLRYMRLTLSLATVMAGKSPSLLALLKAVRSDSILSLQTFQVSQISIL